MAGFLEPLEGRLCMAAVTFLGDSSGYFAIDPAANVYGRVLGTGGVMLQAAGATINNTSGDSGQVLISFYDSAGAASSWSGNLILYTNWVRADSTAGAASLDATSTTIKKKNRAPKVPELPNESRRGEQPAEQASAVVSAAEAPQGTTVWADVEGSTLATSFFAAVADSDAGNTFISATPGDVRGGMLGAADGSAATSATTGSLVQQFLSATTSGAGRSGASAFARFSNRAISGAAEFVEPVAHLARVGIDLGAAIRAASAAAVAARVVAPEFPPAAAALANVAAGTVPPRVFGYSHLNLPYAMLIDSVAAFAEDSATVTCAERVVVTPRANPPWALTFGMLAADLVALAYIHRVKLKTRLATLLLPDADEAEPPALPAAVPVA